ncbi:MAG TPA: hypothetical protein DCS67_01370 [Clostridiales bacterium UBA8960]|nr:hypothetical protein [Clostridiales bacterium UBA8960]
MIDSHVHIIPGVDDGAKNTEQSKEMLEMASTDGINRWIFTPHYNHLCCQLSYDALKAKYHAFLAEHASIITSENTRFGVEVYVDEAFLISLNHLSELPTFENSNYMLVEFSRDSKFEMIQEALYELRIRGVSPILAHVEMYTELLKSPEKVKWLSDEGTLIQVSASSIVRGKYRTFINKLIKFNAIDVVASDGHNLTSRKPVMKDAYVTIAKMYDEAWARRLFVETPSLVFKGEHYVRPLTATRKKWPIKVAVSFLAVMAIVLLGFSVQKPQAISEAAMMPQTTEVQGTETEAEMAHALDVTTDPVDTEPQEESSEAQNTSLEYMPPYDGILDKYEQKLMALQNQYTEDVERLFEDVQNTRNFIVDKDKRSALIEAYMIEAGELETKCDYDVYAVLYDFQNELERFKYPVGVVEKLRAKYHQVKEETKQTFLGEL